MDVRLCVRGEASEPTDGSRDRETNVAGVWEEADEEMMAAGAGGRQGWCAWYAEGGEQSFRVHETGLWLCMLAGAWGDSWDRTTV